VQNSTQLLRETISDSTGNYEIPELPVDTYTVTFEHAGFRTLKFVGVEQVIGRTQTLDATLQVSGGEELVNVSSAWALMDRNTSTVTGLIEREQANQLPLNGRNWSELTAFIPGAIDTGAATSGQFALPGAASTTATLLTTALMPPIS